MGALTNVLTVEWLRWLLTIELLGLAAMPLAAFLFRALPDRGYGLSKPLGMLLVAVLNWWLGSVAGAGNVPALLWALCAGLGVAGIVLCYRGVATLPWRETSFRRVIAVEEGIFLVAFLGWSLVRSLMPEIFSSEKPMDFMLLQASGMAHSFPPMDLWYSGHTVNYYYLGYAIFGMIGRMAGVDPRIGFDLSNVTIFALGCAGGFTLAFALIRKLVWGLAGSFFLMLAGDLDGIAQALTQLRHGGLNEHGLDLWCSTRIIDGGCVGQHTITEFPIFSLLFADLHPHVMAIPFVLLAIGIGIHALFDADPRSDGRAARYGRLALAAIAVGALFAINSWDYPTYLLFVVAALLLGADRARRAARDVALVTRTFDERASLPYEAGVAPSYAARADLPYAEVVAMPATLEESSARARRRDLWRFVEVVAVVPASLLLYLPYLLTVHSATQVSVRVSQTNLGEMLTVMGGLLIPVGIFVLWRAAAAPAGVANDPPRRSGEQLGALARWRNARRGHAGVAPAGPITSDQRALRALLKLVPAWAGWAGLLLVVLPWRTDLVFVALLVAGVYALLRRRLVDDPATLAVLLLACAGVLPMLAADFGFIRDIFSGGANYRLNTVFKLYYQAWILLAVATPFAIHRLGGALARLPRRAPAYVWYGAFALLVIGLGIYPVEGIGSQGTSLTAAPTLDGLAYVRQTQPDVYAAVAWVKQHTAAGDVIAEGEGLSYWHGGAAVNTNELSVFAARPTIVGWPNDHEWLWRGAFTTNASGHAAAADVLGRMNDVDTLYQTTDPRIAEGLLQRYHVQYVYVGPFERATYYASHGNAGLAKFNTLLTPVFTRGDVTIFKVPAAVSHARLSTPLPAPSAPVLPVMTASNVHVDAQSQAAGLKAGEVYLIMHLVVRNTATAPLDFTLDELRLQNPTTHRQYVAAPDANIQRTRLRQATIAPGQQREGDVAFVMPEADSRASTYIVVFQPAR